MPKPGFTIFDSPFGYGNRTTIYTTEGLIWAAQKIKEIRKASPGLSDRPSKDCNACEKLLKGEIGEDGLQHQPGLTALNASATASCDICYLLLESLNGCRELEFWVTRAEQSPPDEIDDDHDTGLIVEQTEQNENEIDEITVFQAVPNWKADRSLQRFRALWRKRTGRTASFQFPGDILGITRLQNSGLTSRSIWSAEHGDSWDTRFQVMREWVQECREQHLEYADSGHKPFPSRVIDIGEPEDYDAVRLAESAGWIGEYTALSYRWGDMEHIMFTTKETLAIHVQRIPLEQLPLTFQHAVRITKELGIRFLWIDALCIVQDDLQDWQQESSKMQDVFSNASITLAAASGIDCNGGLLLPFRPSIHGRDDVTNDRIAVRLAHLHSRSAYPLHDRGWTLQEACLSQRILSFTTRQIIWQCNSAALSEDGMFDGTEEPGIRFPIMIRSIDTPEPRSKTHWYQQWQRLAEDYSVRQLTFEGDKLAAFAGIVAYFQERLQDNPLIGLWQGDLASSLMWKIKEPGAVRQLSKIPSWSWLATPRPIQYGKLWVSFSDENYEIIPKIELLSTSISWIGLPMVSDISEASLSVRGRVIKLSASFTEQQDVESIGIALPNCTTEDRQELFLDYKLDTVPSEVWCLRIATLERDESRSHHGSNVGLILAASDERRAIYHRLGITVFQRDGRSQAMHASLENAPEQSLVLV